VSGKRDVEEKEGHKNDKSKTQVGLAMNDQHNSGFTLKNRTGEVNNRIEGIIKSKKGKEDREEGIIPIRSQFRTVEDRSPNREE